MNSEANKEPSLEDAKATLPKGKNGDPGELHRDNVSLSLEVRRLRDIISQKEMEARELARALENSQAAQELIGTMGYQEVTPEKAGMESSKGTGAHTTENHNDKTTIRKPITNRTDEIYTVGGTPGQQRSYTITETQDHREPSDREHTLMDTPSDYDGTREQYMAKIESISILRGELKKVEDCNQELNRTVDRLKDKLGSMAEFQKFAQQERDNASPGRALTYNSQMENIDGFKGDLENLLNLLKTQQLNYDSGDGMDSLLDRIEDLLRKYVSTNGISEETFIEMMNDLTNIQVDAKIKYLKRENDDLIMKVKLLTTTNQNLESHSNTLMGDLLKRQRDIEMLQNENDSLRISIKDQKTINAGGERESSYMMNQMNTLEMK